MQREHIECGNDADTAIPNELPFYYAVDFFVLSELSYDARSTRQCEILHLISSCVLWTHDSLSMESLETEAPSDENV